nr:DUF3515 domain-containing protein [Spelaeicoccus albus]
MCACVLSGCTGKVKVDPAAGAADPKCAAVMLSLPDELGGNAKRATTSQATAAWGDPSAVILRCGVTSPGPTTTPCVSVDKIDWLSKDEGDHWRFVTYGRTPAVEVLIDQRKVSGQNAIATLSAAVSSLPQKRHCVGAKDVSN